MELKLHPAVETDVLVLGGGGAGLMAAIAAREAGASVLLVCKSRAGLGNNTAMSASGIAAGAGWREPADSPDIHFKDTVIAGRSMNDRRLVEVMAREAPARVLEMEKLGVRFARREGAFHATLMAGHSHPRNVHGEKNTGTDLTLPLRDHAVSTGVQVTEGVLITRLLAGGGAVVGAIGLDEEGGVHVFRAGATVLATGGAGQAYLRTSNAAGSTGDGYALAYEVGVALADMEFVQFNLTGPNVEALCAREGAVLRNSPGENVLEKYGISDPIKMTRDAVARAVMLEILAGRSADGVSVVLDTTPIPPERFEAVRGLLPRGSPPEKRQFEVGLQAHFFMGGARINERTETGVDRFYAAGEVCAGVHGASRLGGNALAEVFVFGKIAGEQAARRASGGKAPPAGAAQVTSEVGRLQRIGTSGSESLDGLERALKTVMWNKAGVVRSGAGLGEAIKEIDSLKARFQKVGAKSYRELTDALRLGNMLVVAEMVTRAARLRTESRGAHYRADFPAEDAGWQKNVVIRKEREGMGVGVEG